MLEQTSKHRLSSERVISVVPISPYASNEQCGLQSLAFTLQVSIPREDV